MLTHFRFVDRDKPSIGREHCSKGGGGGGGGVDNGGGGWGGVFWGEFRGGGGGGVDFFFLQSKQELNSRYFQRIWQWGFLSICNLFYCIFKNLFP